MLSSGVPTTSPRPPPPSASEYSSMYSDPLDAAAAPLPVVVGLSPHLYHPSLPHSGGGYDGYSDGDDEPSVPGTRRSSFTAAGSVVGGMARAEDEYRYPAGAGKAYVDVEDEYYGDAALSDDEDLDDVRSTLYVPGTRPRGGGAGAGGAPPTLGSAGFTGLPTPQSGGYHGGHPRSAGPSPAAMTGMRSAGSTRSRAAAAGGLYSAATAPGTGGSLAAPPAPRQAFFPVASPAAGSGFGSPSSESGFVPRDELATTVAEETALALKAAFVEGRVGSMAWRRDQLRKLGHVIALHRDRLMEALCHDGHCSREALFEIKTAETQIARAQDELDRWTAKDHVETGFLFAPTQATTAAPCGVIMILSSCEYPLMHALVPIASALAAGNCALLCPNPRSPAVCAVLRQVIPALLDENGVAIQDSIFYVPPVVDFVWSADIWNPEPCLKAGGMGIANKFDTVRKCPTIVDDPDVIPLAARRIVEAAFTSAGMFPYKPSYVVTLPKLKAKLVECLQAAIDEMFVRNPFFADEYSRLPDPLVLDQVKALLIEHTDLFAHTALEGRLRPSDDPFSDYEDDEEAAAAAAAGSGDAGGADGAPSADESSAVGAHGPAATADSSRPGPRVKKPAHPPRGGVVAGGRWHDPSLVMYPTVVVCDAGSPLLTEPGQGPILPVVALTKRELAAFVQVRQPFAVLYHFTRRRDKFAPHYARAVVINDTLSPFRVNDMLSSTLTATAPSAASLFAHFSVPQAQLFSARNALAAAADDRSRYPPTTRRKLRTLEWRLGWRTIPVPRAPWARRVADWVAAHTPSPAKAVGVTGVVAAVAAVVVVVVRERIARG
ncbi:hypothetical protein H9P43_001880 [Blastocladiella emersonii ATCC 22665]|nr:hypothetical protein H9P43_001880 [Blastocladiella emersonii ATCC 22665]